jgi:hypothetical protein
VDHTEISPLERKVAHLMAGEFVQKDVDLNEVGKALAYLHNTNRWNNCLTLMKRLAQTGAVRSKQTQRYYQAIYEICFKYIGQRGADGQPVDARQAERILGWAVRVARLENELKKEREAHSAQAAPARR